MTSLPQSEYEQHAADNDGLCLCLCGDPECPRCFVQTTICGACEREWPTNTGLQVCPECGNDGDMEGHAVHEENPRERGDDDGVEYADPGDEMERRLLED